MRDFRVGDMALRPEEDRLHVPTSFELERELRDWEGCALVTWAMRVPPNTTVRHLEEALIADFRLRPATSTSPGTALKCSLSVSRTGAAPRRSTQKASSSATARRSASAHGEASWAPSVRRCSTRCASSSTASRRTHGSQSSSRGSSAAPARFSVWTPTSCTQQTPAGLSCGLGRPTQAGSQRSCG